MSNYQRNTKMVGCIFAVLIIGAVSVGLLAYYGPDFFNWNKVTTSFSFQDDVGSLNETVYLDVDLEAGAVTIAFVDNATLLYDINIDVQNSTLASDGAPIVTFESNTIRIDYTGAGVEILLGSGVNYTIDVKTGAGGIDAIFGTGAHIGDVSLEVTTGGIDFTLTNETIIMGNATIDLTTSVGAIDVTLAKPNDVVVSVTTSKEISELQHFNCDSPYWAVVEANRYETSNYLLASQILDISVTTSVGGISLTLH